MTQVSTPDYCKMVSSLAKPGIDILLTIRPETLHLVHMAIGLSGEMAELMDAIENDDVDNIQEELGDLCFYLEGYCQGIDFNWRRVEGHLGNVEHLHRGVVLVGEILDKTKKRAIYNKPMTQQELAEPIIEFVRFFRGLVNVLDLTMEDVQQINYHKLVGSKNARYKGGQYSDEKAQAREDKEVG